MRACEIEPDPYWTDDVLLGEIASPAETALVRLRLHESEEAYHGRNTAERVPLSQPSGTRRYVHARPYVLAPDITLTVGLFSTPRETGAIGDVVDASWDGLGVLPLRSLARRGSAP